MVDRDLRMLHSFNFLDRINRIYWTLILAFRMKAKKLNRLRRMNKITAIEFLFDYKDEILKGNIVYVFPARRAGLGFATFFWKVAKKRNPDNPVDPVQMIFFTNKIYGTKT